MHSIWDRILEETAMVYRDAWEAGKWLEKIW